MTYSIFDGLLADKFLYAGMLASALSILAFAPYIRDTLRGVTTPDRACWLIWSVLALISGAGHVSSSDLSQNGAGAALFVAVQVIGTFVVFALSVRFGRGPFLTGRNLIILAIASLGLISWAVMDTAAYALALSIGVSAIGGVGTICKAYSAPATETASTWGIMTVAAALGVYSVGVIDPLVLAYPVYLLLLYCGIVAAQMMGQSVQRRREREAKWRARRAQTPPLFTKPDVVQIIDIRRANWPLALARSSAGQRMATDGAFKSGRAAPSAPASVFATASSAV